MPCRSGDRLPAARPLLKLSVSGLGSLLRGAESSDRQADLLYSTVHGAGRVMSRTEAAGKRHRKTGEVLRPGKVTPDMMADWLTKSDVVLRGGGLDESPHAYRRLPDVLAEQGETITIERVLTPLIVVMAGANEFDPYKD